MYIVFYTKLEYIRSYVFSQQAVRNEKTKPYTVVRGGHASRLEPKPLAAVYATSCVSTST